MTTLISIAVVVAVLVIGLLVVFFVGTGMVRNSGGDGSSAGVGNAFGGFDVFDPGRARAQDDLESERHQITVTPSSDDDDRPVRVDMDAKTVRIRRTPPADPAAGDH